MLRDLIGRVLLKLRIDTISRFVRYEREKEIHKNNLKKITKTGKYVVSRGLMNIGDLKRIEIGSYVLFNKNITIMGEGEVIIGSHCAFGSNILILTSIHNYQDPKWLPFDDGWRNERTVIDDHVWVGNNSIIMPGVNIGEGAVIGAGAVVVTDVPPLAIMVGNPAMMVKKRDADKFRSAKDRMKRTGEKEKFRYYSKMSRIKHFRYDI